MEEKMKVWQIIEWCATGAFLNGATFVNNLGQELYFDGETVRGLDGVDINADWDFVTTAA